MQSSWLKRLLFGSLIFAVFAVPAYSVSTTVVISQIYSGQAQRPRLQNDFIELFNLGSTSVDLTGWSVQVPVFTGSNWSVTPLSGSLAPGQYLLISGSVAFAGGDQTPPLAADIRSNHQLNTSGRIALVNTTTPLMFDCPSDASVIDLVSWGSSPCTTLTAPALDGRMSIIRGAGGCANTGFASNDFTAVSPSPRSSLSPRNPCGASPAQTNLNVPAGGGVSKTTPGGGSVVTIEIGRAHV